VCGFYRHPNTPIKDFKSDFILFLNKMKNKKRCFILGDFNLCLTKFQQDNNTTEFIEETFERNFLPLVYLPTRITAKSATIIDHVYSNFSFSDTNLCKAGLICTDISDHMMNFVCLISKHNLPKDMPRPDIRLFTQKNVSSFKTILDNCNWNDVLSTRETDTAYNAFYKIIKNAFDQSFPLVKASNKYMKNINNNKAWITTALKNSINTKSKLYKKWIKSKVESDEIKYKNYANALRKLLRKAEADHYSTLLSTRFNSYKSVWANINRICSDKPFDSKTKKIQKIKVNNSMTSDSKVMAESFNNYFCNIGNDLCSNSMKTSCSAANVDSFKNYLHKSYRNSFVCNHISMNELINTLSNLKDSKSCSCDEISSHLVRLTANQLVIPLLHIFNLSFEQGKFPSALKIAKVIPVFKKGNIDSLVNYRPISLTSPFAKTLERLMYNRLYSYLLKFDILYEHQFGFRKSHSTSMAMIDVINMITNKLDCGYKVMGIFMDLQKAFDTVNLDILIQKLEHYGVRGFVLDWFRSYL